MTPTWTSNPDVRVREEDDGLHLAYNTSTGVGQILNSTSHFIWQLAADGHAVDTIVSRFEQDFLFPSGAPPSGDLQVMVSSHLALLERNRLLLPRACDPAAQPAGL